MKDNNMKNTIVIFILLFFISSFGCSDGKNPTVPSEGENYIFPLKIGNWWDYGNGKIRITSSKYINGITFYKIEDSFLGYENNFLVWWDGETTHKVIPNNPQVGDKWVKEAGSDTSRIVAKTSLTVPAGTFECFQVKKDNYFESWYFALNVGMIKGDGLTLHSFNVQ